MNDKPDAMLADLVTPMSRRAMLPVLMGAVSGGCSAGALAANPNGDAKADASSQTEAEKNAVIIHANCFPSFAPDLKWLKKRREPFATQWWVVKHDGRTFHFCREDPPYASVSRFEIHGWVQAATPSDERLFHIWHAATWGQRDIRLDIDEAAGTLSVVSLGPAAKERRVAFYDLAACVI